VRIDPVRARLEVHLAGQEGGGARTAAQWARKFGLIAVINLGMFHADQNNVGYARKGDYVQSPRWIDAYKSALGLSPREKGLPAARMIDLDVSDDRLDGYDVVVQNLRLLKAPAVNVWTRQKKRWSEAAIASDEDGRILFLFTRSPFSMWELNRKLAALPLRIHRAMHAEGGPEASLSVHAGGVDLDLAGSFETGFREDDDNPDQWPIPNVLGVVAEPE
jgi:hypothetical protein